MDIGLYYDVIITDRKDISVILSTDNHHWLLQETVGKLYIASKMYEVHL